MLTIGDIKYQTKALVKNCNKEIIGSFYLLLLLIIYSVVLVDYNEKSREPIYYLASQQEVSGKDVIDNLNDVFYEDLYIDGVRLSGGDSIHSSIVDTNYYKVYAEKVDLTSFKFNITTVK